MAVFSMGALVRPFRYGGDLSAFALMPVFSLGIFPRASPSQTTVKAINPFTEVPP
jgi:hypothetical protein